MKTTDAYTLWVCVDCYMAEANGEYTEDTLSKVDPVAITTLGLLFSDHTCGDTDDEVMEAQDAGDCSCEEQHFSWSRCDGCGSHLGGSRHALTAWYDERDL